MPLSAAASMVVFAIYYNVKYIIVTVGLARTMYVIVVGKGRFKNPASDGVSDVLLF
jgi:hypothetical protein